MTDDRLLETFRGRARLLAVMAALLVLGIIGMHSLMAHDAGTTHDGMFATSMSSTMQHGEDAHAGHDGGTSPDEGGMTDCGGLMSMCLALVISVVGLVLWPRRHDVRPLWRRGPAVLLTLGEVRRAFEALSPLQRTTVTRC